VWWIARESNSAEFFFAKEADTPCIPATHILKIWLLKKDSNLQPFG
jgi:hypothetical protein